MEGFKPRHEAAQIYMSSNNPEQMVEVGPKMELQWLRDDVDKDKWDRECDENYNTWRKNLEKMHYEVRFQDPTLQIVRRPRLQISMVSMWILRQPDMDGVCVPVLIRRRSDINDVPVLIRSHRRRWKMMSSQAWSKSTDQRNICSMTWITDS